MKIRTAALPVALLLALTGCADDPAPAAAPAGSPSPATSAPPSPAPSPSYVAQPVDWDDPATTAMRDGWSVGPCKGDAPLVCFSRDGAVRGTAEVVGFPADTISAIRDTMAAGGTEAEALQAHARVHLEEMRADRKKGCGADYDFRADAPVAMTSQGSAVIKTAFTGGEPGSAPTERIVRWVGLRDGQMVSVVLHATDDGACAPGLGGDFSTSTLAEVEPLIDELVEASPLPVAAA